MFLFWIIRTYVCVFGKGGGGGGREETGANGVHALSILHCLILNIALEPDL